MMVTPLF